MDTVGIRELKERASEIIRQVREVGAVYQITHHGRVVATINPVEPRAMSQEELAAFWRDWDALGDDISRDWPVAVSAADAIGKDGRHP